MKWLELIFSIIGALGVVVIAVNLWLTRRQNRFVRTFEIYTRLDSPEARKARRYTRHEWNGELAVLEDEESKRELVHRHINDLDVVGSLMLERLTNYALVVRVFGAMIVSSWDKCRGYIDQRRREYFPYFAIHFEAAAKQIKNDGKGIFKDFSSKHKLRIKPHRINLSKPKQ